MDPITEKARKHAEPLTLLSAVLLGFAFIAETSYRAGYKQAAEDKE